MNFFVNLSNHPSSLWSDEQKNAASAYGEIVDITFPVVLPEASEKEIETLGAEYAEKVLAYDNPVAMVQGEYTLTYAVVNKLKDKGITVVASCSDRVTEVSQTEDGQSVKKSVFKFVKFRRY